MMWSSVRGAVLACAVASVAVAESWVLAGAPPAVELSGAWEVNRDLSSAPGIGPGSPGGTGMRRPGGGRGAGGGGGRGPGGGGRGRGGGPGAGGPGGGGRPQGAPSSEAMAARRALMEELLAVPARVTISQNGDKVVFIEPDGVVRTYVANGAAEKHQLTNGTIETKTTWDGSALRMAITLGERQTLIRRFEVRDEPRRLEVVTAFEGGPKDQRQVTVYDEQAVPPPAHDPQP